jgi:carbon storage regulator
MLVLSRKIGESILIDGGIRITIVGIQRNQVRLGFEAPDQIRILREELGLPAREGPEHARSEQPTAAAHGSTRLVP